MKKILVVFISILSLVFIYETVISFDDGIAAHTRKNVNKVVGCICHTADSLSSVVVRITGPTAVAPNSTNTYRITMRGGPAETGGFDFNVFSGNVDTVANQQTTKLYDSLQGWNDISHSSPKPFSGDSVSWLVKYIAPSTNVIIYDTLYATGNSTNNNFFPDDSDRWNFATNFVVEVNPSIGIRPISTIAESFSLGQNFPNPFNPATKIRFSIPVGNQNERFVRLVIFNIQGREVSTLVNSELESGTYEYDWDASNYASGVYYYKLTAGKYSEVKKMVLVK